MSSTWLRMATLLSTYMAKMYILAFVLDMKAKLVTLSMAFSLVRQLLLSAVSQSVINLLITSKRLDCMVSVAILCSRAFLARTSILLKLVDLPILTSPLLKANGGKETVPPEIRGGLLSHDSKVASSKVRGMRSRYLLSF